MIDNLIKEAFTELRAGKGDWQLNEIIIDGKPATAISRKIEDRYVMLFQTMPTEANVAMQDPNYAVEEVPPSVRDNSLEGLKGRELFRVVGFDFDPTDHPNDPGRVECWIRWIPGDPGLLGLLFVDMARHFAQAAKQENCGLDERKFLRAITDIFSKELKKPTAQLRTFKPRTGGDS